MIPANRIKELREAVGLSQHKFAAAIGISYASAQRYEYGQRDIPGDVLLRMVSLFNVSSDYILGVSDERTEPAKSADGGCEPFLSSCVDILCLRTRINAKHPLRKDAGLYIFRIEKLRDFILFAHSYIFDSDKLGNLRIPVKAKSPPRQKPWGC